jgi:hypothetical protein
VQRTLVTRGKPMANALAPTHTLGPHHSVAMKLTLATSQTSFYIWQTHYVGHMPLAAVTNASRHPSPTQAMLPAGTGCSCTLKTGTRATVFVWTCLRDSTTTCCPGTAARPVCHLDTPSAQLQAPAHTPLCSAFASGSTKQHITTY